MATKYSVRIRPLVLMLGAAIVISGCGTGTYNRRMVESLTDLGARSTLIQYLYQASTPLGDSEFSIRIPTFFTEAGVAGDAAQPPFVQLPDFLYAHEVQVADGTGGQATGALYLATPGAAGQTEDELQQAVLAGITPSFPAAAWQDRTLPTLSGGEITVRYLTVSGSQDFGGRMIDGRFDLYLVPGQARHALVGWRAPVGQDINFFQAAEAAIGSMGS